MKFLIQRLIAVVVIGLISGALIYLLTGKGIEAFVIGFCASVLAFLVVLRLDIEKNHLQVFEIIGARLEDGKLLKDLFRSTIDISTARISEANGGMYSEIIDITKQVDSALSMFPDNPSSTEIDLYFIIT